MNVLLKDEKMGCVGFEWSLFSFNISVFHDACSYSKNLLDNRCYSHNFLL